jgi:hypothetical protein
MSSTVETGHVISRPLTSAARSGGQSHLWIVALILLAVAACALGGAAYVDAPLTDVPLIGP